MDTRALIFDFFGVLCAELRNECVRMYAKNDEEALEVHHILSDADMGRVSLDELYTQLESAVSIDAAEMRSFFESRAVLDRELIEYMQVLRMTYQVGICSNAPKNLVQEILSRYHVEQCADVITISSELHIRKPSPEIFLACAEALRVLPAQAVYIDDSLENVAAAKQLGFESIQFTSRNALHRELHERGVNVV